MSNIEHGAIVAELNAGIDAPCDALKAAVAGDDGAAVPAASVDVSRLANNLQVAAEMKAAGRTDDAVRANDDLLSASASIAGSAIDALNCALRHVGIPYMVGPEDAGVLSSAHDIAAARRQYERGELAAGLESGDALRELCIATALLERRQAQVLARLAKQHIARAESATTVAYAAAEELGEITDRHFGAGTWAKLLAG